MYSSADEDQAALIGRGPRNDSGGSVTVPPTVGTWVAATAGVVATSTTTGTVGGLEAGRGLRLAAALAPGVDVRLRYTLPTTERYAEFTITSQMAFTNVIVALHENGAGTFAWAQANGAGLYAAGRQSFGGTITSTGIPYAQGDRIRVASVMVGADTVVTVTNLTSDQSTSATLASASVAGLANMSIIFPVQFGHGSIDNLVVYEGQPE